MNKPNRALLRLLTLTGLLCCSYSVAFTQSANPDTATEVMRQLLSLPAPTPRTPEAPEEESEPQPTRPAKFFRKENPPPDDAPIEDLLVYWRGWASQNLKPQLSDIAKQRLLEACANDIEILPGLVQVFPPEESTAKKIKELFDKSVNDQLLDDSAHEKIQKWLLYNSKYYLSDLFALASKVKDNQSGGYVHKTH